jgi:hypothetical protein
MHRLLSLLLLAGVLALSSTMVCAQNPSFSGYYEFSSTCEGRIPSGLLIDIKGSKGSVCDPAGSSFDQTDDGDYSLTTDTISRFSFSGKAVGGNFFACKGSFNRAQGRVFGGDKDAYSVSCHFNADPMDFCSTISFCKEGDCFTDQDEHKPLTKSCPGSPSPSPTLSPSPAVSLTCSSSAALYLASLLCVAVLLLVYSHPLSQTRGRNSGE